MQVHKKFQNAEHLIEKHRQDTFERYRTELQLLDDPQLLDSYFSFSSNYNYYYDHLLGNLNQHQHHHQQVAPHNQMDQAAATTVNYPLSFIDAVNKKQLDLETGYFKENSSQSKYSLTLADSLRLGLLSPHTAYLVDSSNSTRTYDLAESIRLGLITKNNRILVSSTFTLSLADALKIGHLKIGEPPNQASSQGNLLQASASSSSTASSAGLSHSNSSLGSSSSVKSTVSSETQSMSVKSIKDPRTNEYLAPTDAIKRNLLDPYKGLFFNPITQQHMPISDAIQEGYVLVEMIANHNSAKKSGDGGSSNIVSTSLIRETKSYHLLAVLDTTRNLEISIKEAIARGILDRQKGNDFFSSISRL